MGFHAICLVGIGRDPFACGLRWVPGLEPIGGDSPGAARGIDPRPGERQISKGKHEIVWKGSHDEAFLRFLDGWFFA